MGATMQATTWAVTLTQTGNATTFNPRAYNGRTRSMLATVRHCATVDECVRVAQRAYPGFTVVAAQKAAV